MDPASRKKSPKPVVGIIGGIGSGKSMIADQFVKLGGYLILGDELGHEALRQPAIIEQIVNRWGREVLNEQGQIDRRQLGRIVFAQENERRALEQLVFPHIERRIIEEAEIAGKAPKHPFVVLDAAIMCEAGWDQWCDRLVYVHTPEEIRYERLTATRNWTADELRRREKAQWPLEEKRNRADAVIDNGAAPEFAQKQVNQLAQKWNLVPNEGSL